VHCGVREHLMGAMANGIAAHGGLRVVNVTYLAFSDYERAAMRMAALMRLPIIYVFSHDSIGVGSNGPTHQPIEVLASFRAMPNMRVFRPADAIETAEAWQIALETRDGPSVFALSRQPAEQVRSDPSANLSRSGAYVMSDASGPRALTLIATGTEVGLAVAAQSALEARGIATSVVSMPCWELFADQSPEARTAILDDAPRLAIEAASPFGWSQWLRPEDGFIGMDSFGASATADVLYAHFGITVENIIAQGEALIGQK
jgi:transketolase